MYSFKCKNTECLNYNIKVILADTCVIQKCTFCKYNLVEIF